MNTTEKDTIPQGTAQAGTAREALTLMPVPALAPNFTPPAIIKMIGLAIKPDGSVTMRILIKRDLVIPIKSFIFRYRFSSKPISSPDADHKFYDFLYEESDINSTDTITVSGDIPEQFMYQGCSAYISEITLSSGQKLTFDAAQYKYVKRPVTRSVPIPETPAPKAPAPVAPKTAATPKAPVREKPETPEELAKKKKRRTVISAVVAAVILTEAIGGIFLSRYLGVKSSAEYLMKESRYNEAYKIALDAKHSGILQDVCESAVEYFYSRGDLQSAYTYSYGAPKPFTDKVIAYAAQSVIDPQTGKINETAFRVAKMSDSDEKFDSTIHTIVGMLEAQGDFANAIRVVSDLRDETDRAASELNVFNNAVSYYVSSHQYGKVTAFIDDLENVPTFNYSKDDAVKMASACVNNLGDNAGIIYLAHVYPEHASITSLNTNIESGDGGIRSELAIVYPMLSAEQKRIYHSKTISAFGERPTVIDEGKIAGTDIKDAVSVEENDSAMLVLRKNGSVALIPHKGFTDTYKIPKFNDVVEIALGEKHAVLLHDNGTVTVHGDNSFGQGNVSEWTNIASIAAGQRFTLGLKVDGTVVGVGSNTAGQCNLSNYRNVVDVAACNQSSVLLFSDGTVKIVGYRSMELSDIETETEVTRIAAGGAAVVIEKQSGSYILYSGIKTDNYGNPYNWQSIKDFDVGVMCIAAVDDTGAVYSDGYALEN